jgi:hypothetical protein
LRVSASCIFFLYGGCCLLDRIITAVQEEQVKVGVGQADAPALVAGARQAAGEVGNGVHAAALSGCSGAG